MAPEIPASDLPYRGPPHSLPSTSGVHGYGAAAPENNSYTNQRGPINVSSSFRAPHQGSVSGAELTDSRRKRRKLDENPYGLGQGDDVDESRITDEEHKTRRKAEQEGRRRISEKDRRVCEDRSLEIIKKLVPACQKRTRGTMWKWEVLVATVEHLQAVKKSIQDKEERFQSLVGELQAMKVRNQDLERGLGAAYLRKLEEYVEKLEDMMKTEKQRSHTLQVRVDFLEQSQMSTAGSSSDGPTIAGRPSDTGRPNPGVLQQHPQIDRQLSQEDMEVAHIMKDLQSCPRVQRDPVRP